MAENLTDLYLEFMIDDFKIENLQGLSYIKLNKLKTKLTKCCKKRLLTNLQNTNQNRLNMELESYDDEPIIYNAKREQRKLFYKACCKQNINNLTLINDNFEILCQSVCESKRKNLNAYMNEKVICECGEKISRSNLSKHKQTKTHFNKLKGEVSSNSKALSEQEKREKINSYMNEKLDCECGEKISRSNFSKHKKTKRHLDNIN